MNRPLSDAETTFMPELHPPTEPLYVVDARGKCAWCRISLSAVPDEPRPVFTADGRIVHTHPSCTGAFRQSLIFGPEPVQSEPPGELPTPG